MHERDTRSLHLGSDRRRGRVRFRVALARLVLGAGVALVVGTLAFVASAGPDESAVRVETDVTIAVEPSTTMTLAPPTTGTTNPELTEPVPPGRRRITAERNVGWDLFLVDDGSQCLELVVGPWKQGSILCGVPPATDVVGDVEVVTTPVGGIAIAVVEPTVTRTFPLVGGSGRVGRHPDDDRLAYAVVPGVGDGSLAELMLDEGDNTVARVILPARRGRIGRSELTVVTGPPYGRWPGYRLAGTTGFFFVGSQVVGFYDGPDGVPCVLYRRLGGPHEEVLADACPARDAGRPLVFSRFTPVPMDTPEPGYMAVAVSDQPVAGWRCEQPTGEGCGDGAEVFADPKGTGRVALVQWARWVTPGPHDHVVLVLTVGGEERRVSVPVRP